MGVSLWWDKECYLRQDWIQGVQIAMVLQDVEDDDWRVDGIRETTLLLQGHAGTKTEAAAQKRNCDQGGAGRLAD